MNIARIGNKYLTDTEPWKLIKMMKQGKNKMNISIKEVATSLTISELTPFISFN